MLIAFYMFGWYTPVFRAMYEVMPGVKLFRRPADATFVFGALIAIMAGYLRASLARPMRAARACRSAHRGSRSSRLIVAFTFWLAATTVGSRRPWTPIVTGLCFVAAASRSLRLARAGSTRRAARPRCCSARSRTADLAWNNAPHESTGLPPAVYDALRPDTQNETVALLRQRLAAQQPNHRDRVELIGIGYHWPNICLIHGCEHVFGHNPLRLKEFYEATKVGDTVAAPDQRPFSPLYPSYRSTFADLFGLRLIATGVPVEQIDKTLKPGDLNFVARTKDAYVYENPRALPRVHAGRRLAGRRFRQADRERLAGRCRSDARPCCWRRRRAPHRSPCSRRPAPRASCATPTPRSIVEVDAPSGGMLVLNDVWHPWWRATHRRRRDRDLPRQRAVPRRAGAAGQVHRAVHVRAAARRVAGAAREAAA